MDLCQLSEEDIRFEPKIDRADTRAADVFRSLNLILKKQPRVLVDTMAQKSVEKKTMNSQNSQSLHYGIRTFNAMED